MKKLYLRNVKKGFATNSSSYHSTLIMTDEEYQKWKNEGSRFEGMTYAQLNDSDDDYYGTHYYIEVEEEREINGQKIHAVTYCESNY